VEVKRFHGLDVLRTVLAVTVAIGHFFYWNGGSLLFPSSFFVAVDFFFVLSGFVIAQSIFQSKENSFETFVSFFLVKRIFRLYPLYICMFLITVLLLFLTHRQDIDPFFYFFISFFLLQAIGFDSGAKSIFSDTSIGIAWSLSVEFWVGILFFPIVFLLRRKIILLIYVCVFLILVGMIFIFNLSPSFNVNFQKMFGLVTFGSIRGVIGFASGVISFLVYCQFTKTWGRGVTALLELLVLTIIILAIYLPHDSRNDFISPILFSLFLPLLSNEKGIIGSLLKLSFLSFLRNISYSIYMIHPCLIFVWRSFDLHFSIKGSVTYLFFLLCFSSISYPLVERPFIRFAKRYTLKVG
jgi:peptidoglycan/LPS O-acetylase OafA/YrhL